jgi:hypothetical protein
MNHLLNRRRALFGLAIATMDAASTPEDIHRAAVKALEASFAAPPVRQVIAVAVPVCDSCAGKIERGASNSPEFVRAALTAQASLGASTQSGVTA